jgi:hypothetical protein
VAQAGFQLAILLPQPPKYWIYKCVPWSPSNSFNSSFLIWYLLYHCLD